MRRFFVKNLLFIITVNVLIKPIWVFLIDRTVQVRLGHERYGIYPQLLNIALILQIILDFGLTNYNNRAVAREPDKLKDLFPVMLSARLVLMLAYIAAAYLTAWFWGIRGTDLALLLGVLFIQISNTLLLFLRSNISALHKFKTDGILSVTDRFLMILICGFLLIYPATAYHFQLAWFINAQVISYLLACVAAYVVLKKISPVSFHFSFDGRLVRSIIKESWPYALVIFLMSIYMRIDMVMLGKLCGNAGNEQVSIYQSAYRLLDVSNMFGILFAGVLLPMFGRMLMQKTNVYPIIQVSVNILLPFSFTIGVASAFWGLPIMQRLYPAATLYDARVFAWVMACFPPFCITYIYSTLLAANGSLKILNKIAFAAVIINLSLNLFLIPRHYAMGAAFTSFVTQSFVAVCYIIFSGRILEIPLPGKWALTHLLYVCIIAAAAYGLVHFHYSWILQCSIYTVLCVIAVLLFRFVSLSGLKQLMANK